MWTYTLYTIHAYTTAKKPQQTGDGGFIISVREFDNFIFDEVWMKFQISLYEDEDDLHKDLRLLSEMNYITLANNGRHITISREQWKQIETIAEYFRNNPLRKRIPLVDEYFRRIEAILEWR